MFQSNLSAFIFSLLGLTQLGSGGFAAANTMLLMMDSFVGLEDFRRGNTRRIQEYLSVRIPGLHRLTDLKNLGERGRIMGNDDDDFE